MTITMELERQSKKLAKRSSLFQGLAVCLLVFTFLLPVSSPSLEATLVQDGEKKATKKEPAAKEKVIPWHYRPYKVVVWLVGSDDVRWNQEVLNDISGRITNELLIAEPSAWTVTVSPVPEKWKTTIRRASDEITAEAGTSLFDEMLGNDKLFIVRLDDLGSSFRVRTNEIDLKAWSNGPTFTTPTYSQSAVVSEAVRQITQAFRPVVRIDHRKDREVTCTIRAFGLLRRPKERMVDGNPVLYLAPATESPCWIQKDEVFEPILRKMNRKTKTYDLKGLEAMDFTLLVRQENTERETKNKETEKESTDAAEEQATEEGGEDASLFEDRTFVDSRLQCDIVSAKRPSASLGRRYGKGVERLGLVVRNPPADTVVRLITRRGKSLKELREVPLSGYEIYSRPIDKKGKSVLIGKTDWKGEIVVKPEAGRERVRVLLVKSGKRRLARLPLMPGYKSERQITLPDDEDRLRAEGVLSGLQSEFLDLFARRGVLLARMKLELKKKDFDFSKVERLYKEFRSLRTIPQWNDYVTAQAERLTSYDVRQLDKIKKMFKSLRDVAKDNLSSSDDKEVEELYAQANKK